MTTRTYGVLLGNRASVEAALTHLAKRVARKGLTPLTWAWGKAYKDIVLLPNPHGVQPCSTARLSLSGLSWEVPVVRVPLTIEGESPKFAGWRFVAALQHLDGENIVRALPGETIPTTYRNRGPVCDHCEHNRRRNDTYVLAHEDSRTVQVGSTCIKDFLGSDTADTLAANASILALALACGEGGEEGFGSKTSTETHSGEFLALVAWAVRNLGWVSKSKAEFEEHSTGHVAWNLLTDSGARSKIKAEPSAEDHQTAENALAWAENLSDEEIDNASGDYLHNLRAAARSGLVSSRTKGILASLVVAYQNAVAKTAREAARLSETNEFIGTVDAKVSFGLPARTGKKGQPLKGAPTVLSSEPVTLDFVTGYETMYGYTTVLKFKSAEGHSLVWKASSTNLRRSDVGKKFTLAGTIKAHEDYKGEKQTMLTRCSVAEVLSETSADAA